MAHYGASARLRPPLHRAEVRPLEIDPETAAALGWPKAKYAWVERERRWICPEVPWARVVTTERITDLYVTGTRLRLREAIPQDGGAPLRRLGRKADVSPAVRLLTSIYLSPEEFALLSDLPGEILRKTRHRLAAVEGAAQICVDVFEGALEGLILAEAEFDDMATLAAFPAPDFALREVTEDVRYSGGELAAKGLPQLS
jgi:CYTH domain-containing protein